MTRGYSRRQIGVTEEMIQAFGETVFKLSHNYQVRRGDPIRELDFEEIERQRASLGLSDGQIAEKIGLEREQVTYIRTVVERRRFHTGHFNRLLELGGGRRFRAERHVPHEEQFAFSDDALALRSAMRFDPDRARYYVEQGWWADDTLLGWLNRHAAERPDAPAIVQGDTVMNWATVAEKADRIARALYEIGLRRGDVVAVQLPNVPEFLLAYLAITAIGAVMSTVHMPYRRTEIETLLTHGRARAIICLSDAKDWSPAEAALSLKGKVPSLRHVIVLGAPKDGALSLSSMMESDLETEIATRPVASDPFLLLFTSGTTSAPKAVPLAYHNMLSNARLGAPEHGMGPDDRIVSAAPFSHLFGLYSFHVAMASGAASVLLPVFTPADLAATVEAGRPTGLWTAPAHIAACRAQNLLEAHDLSSLRLVIMSGSACPPELVRWLDEKLPDCNVTQLWGMTETQGALYSRPADPIDVAANTAGSPSPGTEVRIVGPDDEPCPAGEEGELQVRGCLLFPGYFDNDAANREAFTSDGWFKTGDLAVMDDDGNVAITGRIKDVINRGGVKFNPRDIEDLLDSHDKILQSAIVPMPDPVLGERACAFVTPKPGVKSVSLEELCAYLMEHDIAKNKLPEKLVLVDEMPMTPTRKIIKARLKIPEGS